jgi:Malectin domain/Kelch motif
MYFKQGPHRSGDSRSSWIGASRSNNLSFWMTNDLGRMLVVLLAILVISFGNVCGSAAALSTQEVVAMINAGGPLYIDSRERYWEADETNKYYQNSFTSRGRARSSIATQTEANIIGTVDGGLYRNGRSFKRTKTPSMQRGYEIPVPTKGTYYTALLHFAEIDPSKFNTGKRVFDIFVEGVLLHQDFDIFAAAGGGNTAIVLSATRLVNDGYLSVVFVAKRFNPTIAAISVVKATTETQPSWVTVDTNGEPDARHESCFVMVGSKAYLVGGRDNEPISVYTPSNQSWTREPGPGLKLHHMQCVVADGKIWIVSAWTGNCCKEPNVPFIYIYDPVTKKWQTKPGLPEPRRRGGGAAVLYGREIYVVAGNRGGHGQGRGVALAWFDKYNIDTDTWTLNLPDAPHARDHTGGGIVNGKLCVASGRDSGAPDFFNATVLPTDCFNFITKKWEVHANIPQGRAGAAIGTICGGGKLVVAGGEGYGRAWDRVDIFDGTGWTVGPSLQSARHGTGLAFHCFANATYIASGSGAQGGRPELTSVEMLPGGFRKGM